MPAYLTRSVTPNLIANSRPPAKTTVGLSSAAAAALNPVPIKKYWYEKGIVWLEPSLAPCASIDLQSIIALETARGYVPILAANYAPLPISFYDMPIFRTYAAYSEPNTYAFFHVWLIGPVLPLAIQILASLRIGIQTIALDSGHSGNHAPGPLLSPLGLSIAADTPLGKTSVHPRYSVYLPDVVPPPAVFDPNAHFTSLQGETGPM